METTDLAVQEEVDGIDTSTQQLIVFKLGEEEYGISIDQIKEVVFTPNITRMPQVPSYVRGVANIRGNILAIVDLKEKFGLNSQEETSEENSSNYTLVVESQDLNIGILVKEVPNTLTVSSSDIDETINVVQDNQEEQHYIKGIVKIESRLIILIDVFSVMQKTEVNRVLTQENAASNAGNQKN